MNEKEGILNAWIMIEQLSEGSISKTGKTMKKLGTEAEACLDKLDWFSFFEDFLNREKEHMDISDKAFKKSGIVLYFDIFDFQEVVDILREKYNITKTDEDIRKSNKFTLSLSFDYQLNFLAEKLFLTMSGYIRCHDEVPQNFEEKENDVRSELAGKFEEDFNDTMLELSQRYGVSNDNFRYAFLKDLDSGSVSLHSFFIEDLKNAKKIMGKKLERYLNGFSGNALNLDSNKNSAGFNPKLIQYLLQPKHYTLGRFPSNPNYALSFMQQIAVILTRCDSKNNIRSINGPPGTGKTTLLKDVFADLAVSQALSICGLPDKRIGGSLVYYKQGKLGILPPVISDQNIVVASSNNGAVQNIVNELPKKDGIADVFEDLLEEVDYFKDISNSGLSDEENWGMFSLEGGSAMNVRKMLLIIEEIEQYFETDYETDPSVYEEFWDVYGELKNERQRIQNLRDQGAGIDFSQGYDELQKSSPWFDKEFRILQSKLFILSLAVRKQFLFENGKHLKAARMIWTQQADYLLKENGQELITEAWQWLNLAIPVVSTTFASFGRMFQNIKENSIGNLFVDEAGQALPQAGVGAVFRSKRIMVVGDPSQIKPVLTLDSNILALIGRMHNVDESFISSNASVQSIVDSASQYGFRKSEDEWIGIPLWVHRRSDYPMFTISNEISYNGLMVQGKTEKDAYGKACWHHVKGRAKDKFVSEQAELLKHLIDERLKENPGLKDEIYVISPFKNVASRLENILDEIHFTKREKGKVTNVGTIHTFQGKEAEIVYLVLGADSGSRGAAAWSVDEPNMMNVAVTRAKAEFYIIGDKELYSDLGSKTANMTISIIDDYNKRDARETEVVDRDAWETEEEDNGIISYADFTLIDGGLFDLACDSKDFQCSEQRMDDLYVSYINACMGSHLFDGYRIAFDDFRNELWDLGYF